MEGDGRPWKAPLSAVGGILEQRDGGVGATTHLEDHLSDQEPSSGVIKSHQEPSGAIKSHQAPSGAIRGNRES